MFCTVFGVILLLKCFSMDMCTGQTERCSCRNTSIVAFPEESSSNHVSDSEDAGCCNSIMNTENQSIILNGRDHNLKTSRNSTDQMPNISVSFQIGNAIKTVSSLPSSISDAPFFFKNRQLSVHKNRTIQILVKNSDSAENNSPREERNRTSKIKLVGNNLQSDPFNKIGGEFNSSQNNLIKSMIGDAPHKTRDKETVIEELKCKPFTTATNELSVNDATKKELSVSEFGSVSSLIGNFKSKEEYIPEEKYELIDLTLSTPFETFGAEIGPEDYQLDSLRDNNINDYHQISKNELKRLIRKQQTRPRKFYENSETLLTSKYENPDNPSEKDSAYQEDYFIQKLPRIARRHLNMLEEDPYENYLDEKLDFPHENYYKTMTKGDMKPATYNVRDTMSESLQESLDITDKIYMTEKSSSEMHRSNRAESSTTKNETNLKHQVNSNNEIDEDNMELMIIKSEVDSPRAKMKKSVVRLERRTMEKYSHRNRFKMSNQVTKGANEDEEEALIITSGDDRYPENNEGILVGEPDDNGYTKTDYLLVKMKNPRTIKMKEQGHIRETLYRRGPRMLNRDSNILTDEDGEEILIEVPDDDGYTEIDGLWVKKKESTVKPKRKHKRKKLCKSRKTMQKKKYEVTKDNPEDNREKRIKGLTNDEYTEVDDSWVKIKETTVKPKRMHLGRKIYPEKKTMQNKKHRLTKVANKDDEELLIIVPDNDGYTKIDGLWVKMKEITVEPVKRHKEKCMHRFQKKITSNSHPDEENGYIFLQTAELNVSRNDINDLLTSLTNKPLRRKTREHKSSPSYDAKSILYSPENLFSEITNDLKEKLSLSDTKTLTTEDISRNSHNSEVLTMKSDEKTTVSSIHGNFSSDFPKHESFFSSETVKMESEKIIGTRAGNFSKEAQHVSVISEDTTRTSTPTSKILTTVVDEIMTTSNIDVNFRNAILENKEFISNVSVNIETTEKIPSTSISDGIQDLSVSMEGTTQDNLSISSSSILFKTGADENKDASIAHRKFSSSYPTNETFSSTDIVKVHSSEKNIDVHIGKSSNETENGSVSSEGSAPKFLQNETFSTTNSAIIDASEKSTHTQQVSDENASVSLQGSTLEVFTNETFSSAIFDSSDANTKTQDGNISKENVSILSESTTKEVLQNENFSSSNSPVVYRSETTMENNSQEKVNESGSSKMSLDSFSSTVVMTELDGRTTVSSLNRNISNVYSKSETFSRADAVNDDIYQESIKNLQGNISVETPNVTVISEFRTLKSTLPPTSMILTTVADEIMNTSNIKVNFSSSIIENKVFISNVSENFETTEKMIEISQIAIFDGTENISVVMEGTTQANLSISHNSISLKTEAYKNTDTSIVHSNFSSFDPKNETFSTTDIVKVHSSENNIDIHAGKKSDETQNASASPEGSALKFLQNETLSTTDGAIVDTSKESTEAQHVNLFDEKASVSLQSSFLTKEAFLSADSAIFDSSDVNNESQNVNISKENKSITSQNTSMEVFQNENVSSADSAVVYRSETTRANISQDKVNVSDSSKIWSVFFSPTALMKELDKSAIVSTTNTGLISVYPKSETLSRTDAVKVEVSQESNNTLQGNISNGTQNVSIISEDTPLKSKSTPTSKILTTVVDEIKNASNIFANFRNAILENKEFITNLSVNIEATEKMTEIPLKGTPDGTQNISVSVEDTTQGNLSISPISIVLKTETVKNTGLSSSHSNFSSFYPRNEAFSATDIVNAHSSVKNIDIHAGKNSDEILNAPASTKGSAMTFLQNETFSSADIAIVHTSKESTETQQVSEEKASAALQDSTLEDFAKETFSRADSAVFDSSDENTKTQDRNISKENISLLSEDSAMEVLQNENFSGAESAVDYRSQESSETTLVNISKEILNASGSLEVTTQEISSVLSSSMVLMTGLDKSTTVSSENDNLSSVYPKSETFSRTDTANIDISQGSINTVLNNTSEEIRNLSVSVDGITQESFSIPPSSILSKKEADENTGASMAYSNYSSSYSRNVTFSSIDIVKTQSSENNIDVHTEKNSDEIQNASVSSEDSAHRFLQNETFSSADSDIVDTSNKSTQTQQMKVFDENSSVSMQGSTLEVLTKETFSSGYKAIVYSSDENTEIQDRNISKENASILSEDIAMEVLKNETSSTAVDYRSQERSETMLGNISKETLNASGSSESTTLEISSVVSSPMVLNTELDESTTVSSDNSRLIAVYPKSETFSRKDTVNADISQENINTLLRNISDETQNVSVSVDVTPQENFPISPGSILLATKADNNTGASTAHSNFSSFYLKNETFSSIDIVKVDSSEKNIDVHTEKNSDEIQNASVLSEGLAQTFLKNETFSSANSAIAHTSNESTHTQQIKVFEENSSISMHGSTPEVLTKEKISNADKAIVYSSDENTEMQDKYISNENASIISEDTAMEVLQNGISSSADTAVDYRSQEDSETALVYISKETLKVSESSESTTLEISLVVSSPALKTELDESTTVSWDNSSLITVYPNEDSSEGSTQEKISIATGSILLKTKADNDPDASTAHSNFSSFFPLMTEADQNTATSTAHSNFISFHPKNETFSATDIVKVHSSAKNIDIHAGKNSDETQNASVSSEDPARKFLQNETFSMTYSAIADTSKESTETQHGTFFDDKASVSLQGSTLQNLTKNMFSSADSAIVDSSDKNPESQDGNISKENASFLSEYTTMKLLQNVTFSNADSAVIYRSEIPMVNISKSTQETVNVSGSSENPSDLLNSMVFMTELDESTTLSTVNGSLSIVYPKSETFSRTDTVEVDISQESFNTMLGNISDENKNVSVSSEGTLLKSTMLPTSKILTTVVNETMNVSNIDVNFRNAILENKTLISNVSENFETTEKKTEISPLASFDGTENISVVKEVTTQANLSISHSSIPLKTDQNMASSTAHSNFSSFYPKNETFSTTDIVKVHSSVKNIEIHAGKNSDEILNASASTEGSALTFLQNKTFSSADIAIGHTSKESIETQHVSEEKVSAALQDSTLEGFTKEAFSRADSAVFDSSGDNPESQDGNISNENASNLSENTTREIEQNVTFPNADSAAVYISEIPLLSISKHSQETVHVTGSSENSSDLLSSIMLRTELDESTTLATVNGSISNVYPKSETFSRADTVNVKISQESFNTVLGNISDETKNALVISEGTTLKSTLLPTSKILTTGVDETMKASNIDVNFRNAILENKTFISNISENFETTEKITEISPIAISDGTEKLSVVKEGTTLENLSILHSSIPLMIEADKNMATYTTHSTFSSFYTKNETFSNTDIVKVLSSVKSIDIHEGKNSDETQNASVSSGGSALKNETFSKAESDFIDIPKESTETQQVSDEKASASLQVSTLENLTKIMFSSADSSIFDTSDKNPESQDGNISKENAFILSENTTMQNLQNVSFSNTDSAVGYRSEDPLLNISKNFQETVLVTGSLENSSDLLNSVELMTELDESTTVSIVHGNLSTVYPKSEKISRTDTFDVDISHESFNTMLGNISDENKNVSISSKDTILKSTSPPTSEILTTVVDEVMNASNIYVNFRNAISENKTFISNVSENIETTEKMTEILPIAISDGTENLSVVKEGTTLANLAISHSSISLNIEADQNTDTSTVNSNFSSFYPKNETFATTDIVKVHSSENNIDIHAGKNSDETQNASASPEVSALKVLQDETLATTNGAVVDTSKESTETQQVSDEKAFVSLHSSTLENLTKIMFSSADSSIFDTSDKKPESQDGNISKENAFILSENTTMENLQNVSFSNTDSAVGYRSEDPLSNFSKNFQETVLVTGSLENSSDLLNSMVLMTKLDEGTTVSTVNGSLSSVYPKSEIFSRTDTVDVDISQESFNTMLGNISDENKNISVSSEDTIQLKSTLIPTSKILTTVLDEIMNASNIYVNFRNAISENITLKSNVSENIETTEKMTEISTIAISDGAVNLSAAKEDTTQANLSISHSSILLKTDQSRDTSSAHSDVSSFYPKNETFSITDIVKVLSSVKNIDIQAGNTSDENQNASVSSEYSAVKFLENETLSTADSAVVDTSKESTETLQVSDEKAFVSLHSSTLENLTKIMFSSADSSIFDASDKNPESQDGNISKENAFILSENITMENLQNVNFSNVDSAGVYRSEDPLSNISKNFQETVLVTGSLENSSDLLNSIALMTKLDESTTVSTVNGSLSSVYPKSEIFSRTDTVDVDISQEIFNTMQGNISDENKNVSVSSEGTILKSTLNPTSKILTTVLDEIMNASNIYVNFRNAILENKTFISNISENIETTEKMTEISTIAISDGAVNLPAAKEDTTQANLSISHSSILLKTDQSRDTSSAHSDVSSFYPKNETFSITDIVKVLSSVKNIDIQAGNTSDENQNAPVSSEYSAVKFLENETLSTADSAVVDTSKESTETLSVEKVSVALQGSTLEVFTKETFSSADNAIFTIVDTSEKVSEIQLGNVSDETLNVSSSLKDTVLEIFSVSPSPLMTELDERSTVLSVQINFSSISPESETFSSTHSFNVGISEIHLGNISDETRNVSVSSEGTALEASSISSRSMEVPIEPDGNKNISTVYGNFNNDSPDIETFLDQDFLSINSSEKSTEFQTRNVFEETLNVSVSLEGTTLESSTFSPSSLVLTLETANFSSSFSSLGNFSIISSEENAVLSTIALNSDKSQFTEIKIGNASMLDETQTALGTVEGATQEMSSFVSNSVVLNTEQGEIMNASSSHVNVSRVFPENISFSSLGSVNVKEKITNTLPSTVFDEAQNPSVSSEIASRLKFNNASLESDSFSDTIILNIEINQKTNILTEHVTISDETEEVSSTAENTTQAISSVSSMALMTESDEILSSSNSPGNLRGVFFKSGNLSRTDILNIDSSEENPKIQPENNSIENGNFSVSLEDTTFEIKRMHPGFNFLTTVPSKVAIASSSHVFVFRNSSDVDFFSRASFENVDKSHMSESMRENISISDETYKESVTPESKTFNIQPISSNFKAYITKSNESIIIHFTHKVESMMVEVNNTDGHLTIFITPIIKKDPNEITNSSSYGNISDLVYEVYSNTSNLKNEINPNVVEKQSTLFPVTIKVGEFNFGSTAKLKFIPSKYSNADEFRNELEKSTPDSSTQKILSFSSLQNETFLDAVSLSVNSIDQADNESENIEISYKKQNLDMESENSSIANHSVSHNSSELKIEADGFSSLSSQKNFASRTPENEAFSSISTLKLQFTQTNIETNSRNIRSSGEIEKVYSTTDHIYGMNESISFIKSDADNNMNFGSSDAENSVNLSSITIPSYHKITDEFAINPMFTTYQSTFVSGTTNVVALNSNSLPVVHQSMSPLNESLFTETEEHIGISNADKTMIFSNETSAIQKKETSATSSFDFNWNDTVTNSFVNSTKNESDEIVIFCNVTYDDITSTSFSEKYLLLNTNEPVSFFGSESDIDLNKNSHSPEINNSFLFESSSISSSRAEFPPVFSTLLDRDDREENYTKVDFRRYNPTRMVYSPNFSSSHGLFSDNTVKMRNEFTVERNSVDVNVTSPSSIDLTQNLTSPEYRSIKTSPVLYDAFINSSEVNAEYNHSYDGDLKPPAFENASTEGHSSENTYLPKKNKLFSLMMEFAKKENFTEFQQIFDEMCENRKKNASVTEPSTALFVFPSNTTFMRKKRDKVNVANATLFPSSFYIASLSVTYSAAKSAASKVNAEDEADDTEKTSEDKELIKYLQIVSIEKPRIGNATVRTVLNYKDQTKEDEGNSKLFLKNTLGNYHIVSPKLSNKEFTKTENLLTNNLTNSNMKYTPNVQIKVTSISTKLNDMTSTFSAINPSDTSGTYRIIGENLEPEAWPWMVSIYKASDMTFICAGSLIEKRFIISAAHCFIGLPNTKLVASIGKLDKISKPNDGITIGETVVHQSFDASCHCNDIAILRLSQPVSQFMTIGIPEFDTAVVGENTTLLSWEDAKYVKDGRPSGTNKLQTISHLPIQLSKECRKIMKGNVNTDVSEEFEKQTICAGIPDGSINACLGNSGGPLMHESYDGRWNLLGIVSFGYKCGLPGVFGLYTRVSYYSTWIWDVIDSFKV